MYITPKELCFYTYPVSQSFGCVQSGRGVVILETGIYRDGYIRPRIIAPPRAIIYYFVRFFRHSPNDGTSVVFLLGNIIVIHNTQRNRAGKISLTRDQDGF